jgi:hypothetical protein
MTQVMAVTGTVGAMRRCGVRVPAGVVVVLVAAGLAGCSSDPEPSAAAPAEPVVDVCASADALRASLSDLEDVDVVAGGTDALQEAWDGVQADWDQFADDAGDEFADEVDGVQADADAVRTAVDSVQSGASVTAVADAATAVGAFLTGAEALLDEVGATC